MKDKKFLFIVILLFASAIISWNLYFMKYLQKDTVDIAHFPRTIASWVSEDLPLSQDDYAILETKNVFVRKYTNPQGQAIYLFIVYSQNNRKVSHPPEVCYVGGGVSILERSQDIIPVVSRNLVVDVNRLLLTKANEEQVAFYWFKVGGAFTASYWKQQVLIVLKTLFGKPASSALIRISMDTTANNQINAAKELKEFANLIIPDIFTYLP